MRNSYFSNMDSAENCLDYFYSLDSDMEMTDNESEDEGNLINEFNENLEESAEKDATWQRCAAGSFELRNFPFSDRHATRQYK